MIKRSTFAAGYRRAQGDVEACLSAYLKAQGEEQVHQLRTAIRRFDRCSALLPASLRKGKAMRRYRFRLRKLLKLNNRLRDLDTIRRGMGQALADPDLAWLRSMISSERSSLEGPARQLASSIAPQGPAIDWDKIGRRKLRRRFVKVAVRMLEELEDDLGVVLRDPRATETMHSLRIAAKELRYTLELLPKEEAVGVLRALKGCQDALGSIRDIDITTEYLRGFDRQRGLGVFIAEKREERRQLYLRFVDAQKRYPLVKRTRAAVSA